MDRILYSWLNIGFITGLHILVPIEGRLGGKFEQGLVYPSCWFCIQNVDGVDCTLLRGRGIARREISRHCNGSCVSIFCHDGFDR